MSQWLDYKKSKKQEETKTTRTIDKEKQLSPSKMSSITKTPIEIKLMKLAGADLTKPTVPQWKPVEGPVVIKQEDMEITSTVSTTEADKSERTDSSPIHLMGKPVSRPSYHVSEDFSEDTICGIPFPVTVGYESQEQQAEGSPNAYRQHYTSNRDHFRRYFTANPYPVPQMITKRKHEPAQEVTPKRQKVDQASKTPSAVLNELYPGLVFEYSNQLGPAHDPKFEVYVSLPLNNKKYQGSGRSKKLAKQNVAETILLDVGSAVASQCKIIDVDVPREAVHDIPMPEEIRQESHHEALRAPSQVMAPFQHEMQMQQSPEFDFTSDDLADLAVSGYPHASQATMLPVSSAAAAPFVSQNILKRLMKTDVIDQPICALHGILGAGDDISYELLPVDTTVPQHQRIYRVKLTCTLRSFVTAKQMGFQEQVFIGEGKSKKQAKGDAARLALISIIGPEYFDFLANLDRSTVVNKKKGNAANRPMKPVVAQAQSPAQETEIDPEAEDYSLAFSQKVKTLITEKHAELMQGDPTYSPNKVLAGIVMTLGSPLIDNMHVIAVTTGTKCINGDFMSDKGVALNDCHAEILATRCLRDFLYSQIDALVTTLDSGDDKKQGIIDGVIFEKQEKTVDGVLRFQLKPNVKFHLYISTSPCGDARIFSPKGLEVSYDENSSESSPSVPPGEDIGSDSHPNRINRGLLRAKIEAGEGTIPVANLIDSGVLQTWDGIMLGNALRTMSCSDKICRWNVIGAQGALLSLFIDPIYYSSIILGSLHHPIHFKRAVYSRIESIPPLPPPYRLNKPRLLMVANKGKRRVAKSPNHSVIWTCSWNSHEVVSSAKGRCEPAGVTSRLCKRLAFMRFLKYYKNDTGRLDNYAQISYDAAKNLATTYQASKQQLIDYMDEIGYGGWIAKPLEQDTFFI